MKRNFVAAAVAAVATFGFVTAEAATIVPQGTVGTTGVTGLYPTALSGDTTGASDSLFLGAPDDQFLGIGGKVITYDFGSYWVTNAAGNDFNIYEVNSGVVEFDTIKVYGSLDNITYTLLTSASAKIDLAGDERHNDASFARSYDLGTLANARYIRIDGNGTGTAGSNYGFDLDAIGAAHFVEAPVAVPGPIAGAGLPALLGLGGFVWARRRKAVAAA